ncbi:recombinase [Morganella morganii]|uniref:Recombinase n=1 Tax=Morganella morganii TaxID=582 RepID=A0A8I0PYF2_MORMO|nr:phage protein NinX family protein [Morganella morganii]MBE8611195.1 recombinase [Morganella morganii]
MNKYRDKSDFEINKAVFRAARIKHKWFRFLPHGVVTYNIKGDWVIFDPCNNPAYAMPIIIENKICMNYIDKDIGWGARHFDEEKGELEIYDKHYYRAAMICFLIMKEAENEKS